MKKLVILLGMVVLGLGCFTSNASALAVDVELQLLVDVSGSINDREFDLQREGYANAFRDAAIQGAITDKAGGGFGAIAVQMIYWSGAWSQAIGTDWTLLDSAESANDFATAIETTKRPFGGWTAPGNAIDYGSPLFDDNGFEGSRLVIDVSGDGKQNQGLSTASARDAAADLGITINGLVIGGSKGLEAWYRNNVVTSDGFVVVAKNFSDFGDAVKTKIYREIEHPAVPEPGTMVLLGIGLLGAARVARRER